MSRKKLPSKIPAEIHQLVPEELRFDYGIYWHPKCNAYYVYRDLGNPYSPEKKRSISKRIPLGSIRNGVFKYSPKYLREKKISELGKEIEVLKNNGVALKSVEETIQKSSKKGLIPTISTAVKEVCDPRQEAKVCFPLHVVLFVALLAACGGYTSAVSIAIYWRQNRAELETLIDGFPTQDISHDTVNRILSLIQPEHFQELMRKVTEPLIEEGMSRVVHIDGQAVRASKTENCPRGQYVFGAYDSTNGVALASKLIGEKTNEISEAIDFLNLLDLNADDVVTADAMNTQKTLVSYLVGRGIGYCLAIKENQPKLASEIRALFNTVHPDQIESHSTLFAGHDRIENRTVRVIPGRLLSPEFKKLWDGLGNGCIIEATTEAEQKSNPKGNEQRDVLNVRYFISSLSPGEETATRIAEVIRSHWSIENNMHWVLDNHFDQDRIQCTRKNYLINRVTLNKFGLNVITTSREINNARNGTNFSIKTCMQMSNRPSGALEAMSVLPNINETLTA